MNAVTAFLNFPIKEMDVYMKLPDGYKRDGFIALLRKILYGLKQSANQWFEVLKKLFIELKFIQLQSDTAICIKNTGTDYMVVAVIHVDDILLIGSSRTAIEMAKKGLKKNY